MLDHICFTGVVAAAGIAEMTQQEQRELDFAIFVGSLIPLTTYAIIALVSWVVIYRQQIRSRRVSIQSLLVATALVAPTLLLAKFVAIPYWW